MRIHVFGASGSGTTTLGRALADRLAVRHFDTDDFFWQRTEAPFRIPNEPSRRVELLERALSSAPGWVLSGSLCGWGDRFVASFTLAVFVWIPPDVRLARVEARERARYGARIEPGGDMHEQSREFVAWAARYDSAGLEQRSRALHERWMATLSCPLLRIEEDASVDAWVDRTLVALR